MMSKKKNESLLAAISMDERYSRLLRLYDMHVGLAGGIQEILWEIESAGEWLPRIEWHTLKMVKAKQEALKEEILLQIAVQYELDNR